MPLYKEWNIGDHALAAIWKVEEPEAFFAAQTGIVSDIKNEQRRTEHLAGRFLLTHLEQDFPLQSIFKDDQDKPRVPGNKFFFSISHSWPYIAAVIDTRNEAGIDIQTWRPGIQNIQHKFLSPFEQAIFGGQTRGLTLAWAAKETVYKWKGKRGMDFIKDLPIGHMLVKDSEAIWQFQFNFNSLLATQIAWIDSIMSDDFACAYISKVTYRPEHIQN